MFIKDCQHNFNAYMAPNKEFRTGMAAFIVFILLFSMLAPPVLVNKPENTFAYSTRFGGNEISSSLAFASQKNASPALSTRSPDPQNLLTLHRLDHLQVYPFTYHNLKLNLASRSLPQLRRYINYIERALPHELFMEGPRASSTRIQTDFKIIKRNNIAPELCRLALATRKTNESPHNAVENFFLINDSTTICKELPVFLKEGETHHIKTHLTGHIDLIQVRFGKLYILDYKPNLKKPENYASQLYFYKEAVHKRTRIPMNKIIPAVFNSYVYYELI